MLKALLISGIIVSTPTVGLHRTTPVHASPGGRIVGAVKATEPDTGESTVLPIISERDVDHRDWLHVRLPYRPDGATGWISTTSTTISTTFWSVYVDRAQRMAHIYLRGKLIRTYHVVVGRPSLPTPTGNFFVTEIMYEPGEVTGPYALATSAYSNVLQEFDGGPGQVAMHGREGLPEPIGTASSHGCIRFENSAITWLALHLENGVPVIIH
jgi:lipoprotein-anchoring transpeptidase ErfK/SrfK